MDGGSVRKFLSEKLKEVDGESVKKIVSEKLEEIDGESVKKFVLEKLKEFLLLLENFWGFVKEKFDEVLPPETRDKELHHWLQVGVPVAVALAGLVFCLWCCCRCCCRSSGRIKMMKAPGRGYMMPRHVFESDPRSYFQDLRGGN